MQLFKHHWHSVSINHWRQKNSLYIRIFREYKAAMQNYLVHVEISHLFLLKNSYKMYLTTCSYQLLFKVV